MVRVVVGFLMAAARYTTVLLVIILSGLGRSARSRQVLSV